MNMKLVSSSGLKSLSPRNKKVQKKMNEEILLGTPETSLRGLRTRNVLSVFRLMLSSEPAGIIMGRNLKGKVVENCKH